LKVRFSSKDKARLRNLLCYYILRTEDELFKHLIEEINRQSEKVYLDIPELIDFQETSKFKISVKDGKRYAFSFEELYIESFYQVVSNPKKTVELEDLRKWELILLGVNQKPRKKFQLLRCLVFEWELEGGKEYHFSHGQWYGINQEFSQQLKGFYHDSCGMIKFG